MELRAVRVIGVIPARYHSTRLDGKVLADICGKPMIQHVYERARQAYLLDDVIVATDDERIWQAVKAFGGEAVMTSPHHASGTDRIGEAVRDVEADIVVNIQGDEPLIDPSAIDAVVEPLVKDGSVSMATLMQELTDPKDHADPNLVKVVTDKRGFALYFSRSTIPYPRDRTDYHIYGHIGIYAYRKEFLLQYIKLESTILEKTESLEQLRVLESGFRIKVVEVGHYQGVGVDTQEDLERARSLIEKNFS